MGTWCTLRAGAACASDARGSPEAARTASRFVVLAIAARSLATRDRLQERTLVLQRKTPRTGRGVRA
jgi:hypothetical protein